MLMAAGALGAGIAFTVIFLIHGLASLLAKLTGWELARAHVGWVGTHVVSFCVGKAVSPFDPFPSPFQPFMEICKIQMGKGDDVSVSCFMPPKDAASMLHLLINKDKMTSSSPSRGLSLNDMTFPLGLPAAKGSGSRHRPSSTTRRTTGASGSSKSMFKLLKSSGGYYGDSDDEGASASSALARRM